eukprot:403345186
MSSVYFQEPPTSGKVILKTNYGDIEIELWCNEAPRTCRNFLQLCLEGYYDQTIFHRIIKGFMVQGGDPTGTGQGGQSIYNGKPFQDEFHSRLKFSHRGIVAMANTGIPNSNLSQFFMTVDACDFLDGKHTIFGKVEGQTVFNLLKISEVETDNKSSRPICDPIPKVNQVEVTINSFQDIVPRNLTLKDKYEEEAPSKSKTGSKNLQEFKVPAPVKNTNLLSFDEEYIEEGGNGTTAMASGGSRFNKNKIKSSHDVLVNDTSLSKKSAISQEMLEEQKRRKEVQEKSKDKLKSFIQKREQLKSQFNDLEENEDLDVQVLPKQQINAQQDIDTDKFSQEMQSQFKNKLQSKGGVDIEKELKKLERQDKRRKRSRSRSQDDKNIDPTTKAIKRAQDKVSRNKRRLVQKTRYDSSNSSKSRSNSRSSSSSSEEEQISMTKPINDAQKQALQKTREEYNNLKADQVQFKKEKIGTLLDEQNLNVQVRVSALQLQREKYLRSQKMTKNRENETLSKLNEFASKLRSKEVKTDEQNWMNNKLKFHIDSQKAYDVNRAVSYAEAQASAFERFAPGGNEKRKYDNAYANVKRPDLGEEIMDGAKMEEMFNIGEIMSRVIQKKQDEDHNKDDGQINTSIQRYDDKREEE